MKLEELYLDKPRLVNAILGILDMNIGDLDKFEMAFGGLIDPNADPEEISQMLYGLDDKTLQNIHRKVKNIGGGY